MYSGLNTLDSCTRKVLIHDGARPLIKECFINQIIDILDEEKGCVLGVKVKDTYKKLNGSNYIEGTVPRHDLIQVQTPQGFHYELIKNAYEIGMNNCDGITDDSMMVERFTEDKVKFVEGDSSNIKITTPDDLIMMETFLHLHRLKES